MQVHDQTIARFRRRLGFLYALKLTLGFATAWAFVWGTLVLALRAASGTPMPWLVWGLALIPLATIPAVLMAVRRLPPTGVLRALLDRHSGSGGLVMAGEAYSLDSWKDHLPESRMPGLRWRGERAWGLCLVAACFLGASFLVPQRYVAGGIEDRLDVDREVDKLAGQVELLKEEAVLDPVRGEAFKNKLEQLRDEAAGRDPVKTLEALDHLADLVNQLAKSAAETTTQRTEQLANTESLAEALDEVGATLDPKTKSEAMAELAKMKEESLKEKDLLEEELLDAEMLKDLEDGKLSPEQAQRLAEAMKELTKQAEKALEENELLREELGEDFVKELQEGEMDSKKLQKLANAAKQGKDNLTKKMNKLFKAGLIDMEALKKGEKAGKGKSADLAAFLKDNPGNLSSQETLAAILRGQRPGRGGIDRGRGDADITFGDASTEEGVKFKEEALPTAKLEALKDSKLTGLTKGAPEVEDGNAASKSGALAGAAAGAGSANTQVILPRHRGAVERFFERPGRKKAPN